MQTFADVRQLPRREVDPLLLYFRTLVLAVSALLMDVGAVGYRLQLCRHGLHGASEIRQLRGNAPYVLFRSHTLRL